MKKLQAAMEARGVTVKEVAEACGRSETTVAKWLCGGGRGFSVADAKMIRARLFPANTIDELFFE